MIRFQWVMALAFVTCLNLIAQDVRQERGVDPDVDYAALAALGPWDDRNYQLTAEDLALLAPDEARHTQKLPAFFRVELRKRFPDLYWGPGFEYGREIEKYYKHLYGSKDEGEPARAAIPVTVNESVNLNTAVSGNEITVAINPVFPLRVIAGSNTAQGVAMYYSEDGGQTWSASMEEPGGVLFQTRADPTVGWSSDGLIAYAAALTSTLNVNFYRSIDFGVTWADPITLTPDCRDKEFLHVDTFQGSPHKDNVYMGWNAMSVQQFSRSTDMGLTFDPVTSFDLQPVGIGCDITSDHNGHVYYFYPATADREIKLLKSIDGGVSFADAITVAQTTESFEFPIPAMQNRKAWVYASADADTSGGPFHGSVYVTWTDLVAEDTGNPDLNHAFVTVAYSRDGGVTWNTSNPHPLTDVDDVDRFNQWISVDNFGNVHMIYYDTRHDPTRQGVDLYYTLSQDGGVTWREPVRVSSQTSIRSASTQQLGDYNGISVFGSQMQISWTDNRDGQIFEDAKTSTTTQMPNPVGTSSFYLSCPTGSSQICAAETNLVLDINVNGILGFSDAVALEVTGLPKGVQGQFTESSINPGATTDLTLTIDPLLAVGTYAFEVTGSAAGVDDRSLSLELVVVGEAPVLGPVEAPVSGALITGNTVTLDWPASTNATYRLQVSRTSDFSTLELDETLQVDSRVFTTDDIGSFFWRYGVANACADAGFSTPAQFIVRPSDVLVVDDDNSGNAAVLAAYTDALDAVGLSYDVYDVASLGNHPNRLDMDGYRIVIWFTGQTVFGLPNETDYNEMAAYLAEGGKIFISSKSLNLSNGAILQVVEDNFGVVAINNNAANYDGITSSAGSAIPGLPNIALSPNDGQNDFSPAGSDTIFADGVIGQLVFNGVDLDTTFFDGTAGVSTDNTIMMVTPFESIAINGTRSADSELLMGEITAFLDACSSVGLDGSLDFTVDPCTGDVDLLVTPSGGAGPYSVEWGPADILDDAFKTDPIASSGIPITFNVTVTDDNGCAVDRAVTISPELAYYGPNLLTTWNNPGAPSCADAVDDGLLDVRDLIQAVIHKQNAFVN